MNKQIHYSTAITKLAEERFRLDYKERTGSIKNARKAWLRKLASLRKSARRRLHAK